jgi:aspartate carbamoyltransferase catalytic subunit
MVAEWPQPDMTAIKARPEPPGVALTSAPAPPPHACPRSLLSVTSLSVEEVSAILHLATQLEAEEPLARAMRLARRRVALLFYESSTRTRTSFELAAKGLGADTALISSQSSSIEKGESLKDTGITLRALGAECIILRHLSSGAPYLLAQATGLPVLNAGDGMHEHPSQALLDLRTILAALGRPQDVPGESLLEGVTVTIVGDILHSRVARSNSLLLPQVGARVILCGPPALLPEVAQELGPGITIERDFDRALERTEIVMMLRIQKERVAGVHIDLDEYMARYQLHQERLHARGPNAIVMHPGPMIRGLEITSEVADGPQSVIAEQVRNGVAIRMALIHRALAPDPPPRLARNASPALLKAMRPASKPTPKRPADKAKKRGGS